MDKEKILKMIPNMLTFSNGLLGISAIMILAWSELSSKVLIASALVAVGAAIDFLDGYLARKLNASSDFGKQLDSFADLLSFGIAPMFILHYMADGLGMAFILPISVVYLIAGVYRLARYNINDFSNHFMGLPITVAGVILAGFCALFYLLGIYVGGTAFAICAVVLCLILSGLMVSRIRVRRC
jgi:CDP-diacylglycerol--serine O-phosphatidyltransferase